jgi:hypothetical protein
MSETLPPIVTIFDGINYNSSFYTTNDDTLTYDQASKQFLKYPIAQGTENLKDITVTGNSTFSKRPYQQLNANWASVNGYLALDKDFYPKPNPKSSGIKAVSSTWTNRAISADTWRGICWSPQLAIFVAVGAGPTNYIGTSPDGITWTYRTAPATNTWIAVVWSPELSLFVAVATSGTGNRVMTSIDGTTWIIGVSPQDNNWANIIWSPELGLFVAVADGGGSSRIMYSSDGANWNLVSTSSFNNQFRGICWSPELGIFVATSITGNNRVITSTDGINWTVGITPVNNDWGAVCWSPELGLFVACSQTGTGNRIITSPDGINWTVRDTTGKDSVWAGISWSPELGVFVAVAYFAPYILYSTDGINWTVNNSSGITTNINRLCWSPELGIFCAIANGGTNRIATSSLRGRPPTSYNLFDNNFNRIDETGLWTINGSMTNVNITNNNNNSTFYPTFVSGSGNVGLFADITNGPMSYNPSTSTLTATTFSGTATFAANITVTNNTTLSTNHYLNGTTTTGTGRSLISSTTTFPYVIPQTGLFAVQGGLSLPINFLGNSFALGLLILTNNDVLNSVSNFSFNITADVAAMQFINFRIGGIYRLFIANTSGSGKTISRNLGPNIFTSYTSGKIIDNGNRAILDINFDGTSWYVNYIEYFP